MKADSKKQTRRPLSARELAVDIITRVEQEQAYSNLELNQSLLKHPLNRVDASLLTELVYGTIQRLNTIDYYMNRFVKKGLDSLQPWVRSLLRISFYQLYYLDRIPAHAVVNEAVEIAKRKGHQGISGLINGVLRSVIRDKAQLKLPANMNRVKRISLTHSHPEWLVARWIEQFGEQTTESICDANNHPPRVSVRVNRLRHDRKTMTGMMEEQGLQVQTSVLAPEGIIVENGGNMALTPWYADGDFSIQDESSMLVAEAVAPEPGMLVLDCCAAPGGKTTHIAEKMNDQGTVWAVDVHAHKEKLIHNQVRRLGLQCIQTKLADARQLAQYFPAGSFDRILLDAPCSGFGVIRRKPDIKWAKHEADIGAIAQVQSEILSAVQGLLRPGGLLIYSTCTIEFEENEAVIARFLQNYENYQLDDTLVSPSATKDQNIPAGMLRIMPQQHHSDGFFVARLKKLSH